MAGALVNLNLHFAPCQRNVKVEGFVYEQDGRWSSELLIVVYDDNEEI